MTRADAVNVLARELWLQAFDINGVPPAVRKGGDRGGAPKPYIVRAEALLDALLASGVMVLGDEYNEQPIRADWVTPDGYYVVGGTGDPEPLYRRKENAK